MVRNISPLYLVELLPDTVDERVHFSLRSIENFYSFSCRTARFQQSFFPSTINLWNSLSVEIEWYISLPTFKSSLYSGDSSAFWDLVKFSTFSKSTKIVGENPFL